MSNSVASHGHAGLGVAFVAGALAVLLALALAEFVSAPGHRINTTALPAEAQAILAERPGTPITTEQWRRLDAVMSRHGGWPQGGSVLVASIRHSWYWFVCLPVLAAAALRLSRRRSGPLSLALVALPSFMALALAFLATHGSLA
jgi:hypothetical protein